jgi:hypothetical protein
MTEKDKAILLMKVNDDLFEGIINNEEIMQAYRLIPDLNDFDFGIQKKMIVIKRYVTFNRQELEYTVANSDNIIRELEEQIFDAVTPTIVNGVLVNSDKELIKVYNRLDKMYDNMINNITNEEYIDMPTELINNQTTEKDEAKEPGYVLPKPAVKHPGRPKGSKGSKGKGKR